MRRSGEAVGCDRQMLRSGVTVYYLFDVRDVCIIRHVGRYQIVYIRSRGLTRPVEKLQVLKVRVVTLRVSETVEKHAFLARAPKATDRAP